MLRGGAFLLGNCLFAIILLVAAPARAKPPGFDPGAASPYFADGPAAEARRKFQQELWADAAKSFEAYLKAHPKAQDRLQATFLAAYAMSKSGRHLDAARRFDELAKSYALLADHHRIYAARAYLAAKQWSDALARAKDVDSSSPLDGEARLARADALRQLTRLADAEKEYRGYLATYPASWREPEVRFRIAEIAAQDDKRWPEARAEYLVLHTRFPTESWGRAAEERLRARDREALALSASDHLTRGLALFNEMRNLDSEAELKAALDAGGLDAIKTCVAAYHRAQSVFKARERPRAAALFDIAIDLCEKAPKEDPQVIDLRVKALYQGARCHAAKGEATVAGALFARAEKDYPEHSYADDARLRLAEVEDGLAEKARAAAQANTPWDGGAAEDHEARATALLGDLADKYPTGDMRSEALFRLFFRAWKNGNIDVARKWLDTALSKVPREEGWWDAGRTLYWLGRVADKQGRPDEARAFYTRCAREYPLAYYALAAINRLRESASKEAQKLIEELRKPTPTPADAAWRFAPRSLFGEPGFRRGVELARLGLGTEARREFAALGIKAPSKMEAKAMKADGPDAEELLWLVTVLYDRAGEYAQSHWIPRHTLTEYAAKWPIGGNKKRWLLSYPRGYAALIEEHTAKNGQPSAIEFAIVREESAFDPLLESFANAVGLTQLTAAPAKRFAQGLPYTREALRDPAINVAIGAREFGYLWGLFEKNPALAIAGYNAGDSAVRRWLRAAPAGQSLDEWIESIPYDETRGYTKRVLSSYFTYRWLYDDGKDPVPPLPFTLPKR